MTTDAQNSNETTALGREACELSGLVGPRRVQLSRRKGYHKPGGAVVVARPTKWGNPFRWQDGCRASAVDWFDDWLESTEDGRKLAGAAKKELRGKDLACWCPLDEPCHADVLIRVANS